MITCLICIPICFCVCAYYKNRKVKTVEPLKDYAKNGKDGNLTKRGLKSTGRGMYGGSELGSDIAFSSKTGSILPLVKADNNLRNQDEF